VDTSNLGEPIASRDIYDASYSITLLPRIFPEACGGDIPAIINIPLRGDKFAPENVASWAIHMAKVPHSVSLDSRIFDNQWFYTWVSALIDDPDPFLASLTSFKSQEVRSLSSAYSATLPSLCIAIDTARYTMPKGHIRVEKVFKGIDFTNTEHIHRTPW